MREQQTVRVYVKPACVQCNMTKRWLDERSVPYVLDDATDPQVIEAAKALGIMAAPIVVVDQVDGGTAQWGGFQPGMLDEHVVIA